MTTEEILKETDDLIEKYNNVFNELNEKCIEYTYEYDEYAQKSFYDASLLKEKMKQVVVQAVPNDI